MQLRRAIAIEQSHEVADIKGRSARGVLYTVGGQAVRFALQMLSTVVLARLLAPGDFGLVAMVTAITGFLGLFKDLGLGTATVQRDELTAVQVTAMFWLSLLASAAVGLVTVAAGPLIAWFYGDERLVPIAAAVAVAFVLTGLGIQHLALIRRQMRFAALAVIEIVSTASGVAAGISLALLGAGYWALVAVILMTQLVTSAGAWTACAWVPGRPRLHAGVRRMVTFGANLTGFTAVNYVTRNLDNVLIGWYWGASALGLYSRAYQLMVLPLQQVNAPLAAVAVPALSRLQGDGPRYRRAYLRVLEPLNLLIMPAVAYAAVTSDWLIRILLGPGWDGAARIFLWLSLGALLQPAANTTGWLFISQGRTGDMFRWGIIGGALAVASFAAGLPFGPAAVAATYTISGGIIGLPILLWMVGRKGPVSARDVAATLVVPAGVAAVVAGLTLLLRLALPDLSAVTGVLLSAPLAALAGLGLLLALPTGRRRLAELTALVRSAISGERG
jgi:PST family polysaccharide transporter